MKCPKCGYENDNNAYFCEGCGNKLKKNTGVKDNQVDNAKFELDKDLDFDSNMNYGTINKSNLEDNSSFDYYDDFNKKVSYENPQSNYPKPPKNNKNLLITVVVVSAIAVIAICVCVFLIFFNDKDSNSDTSASETVASTVTETTTVTTTTEETEPTTETTTSKIMPNVIGLRKEEASKILRQQNISIRYEEEKNNIYSEGVVTSQSISSGETVRDGETVTLYVSLGSDEDNYDNGDYIIPNSDSRYISTSELESLNGYELDAAINEIYAREHRKFKDPEIQRYFNEKSWYDGYIEPDDFKESMLNDYERKNVDTIVNYLKKLGYRD
ncbi:MAG: YARHG domain-containing protein [Ruminococcus sp.]|nr:YARHG domain-containing protein [Ruminococcus sp.]MCI5599503.1 YARHG domain-containing protein [Ruminococcus sp.]MDD6709776.1 YARHG domain-containing protein [Ruminococcus sp.]